ncbi:DUF2164 domain-containing protein [Paenibacillus sp. PAMC21692]|uniref:DUF2164 domain-containing protein n=1 Tax=Paenibacillus sp. PAMC21692 TaxID=2762320 RepID=UPI00164E8A1C|nr:DUF2164 domain-containing protein [Paenibacillus sp. PAMC21692]QNK57640.1 DUF2164 domain-containing protein [Paenibacillus sp. PAMC21692]
MSVTRMPRETKQLLVSSIRQYLETELDKEIGELAGEQFLDYLLSELTPHIYNGAIDDARKLLEERMAAADDDLYALKKPFLNGRR